MDKNGDHNSAGKVSKGQRRRGRDDSSEGRKEGDRKKKDIKSSENKSKRAVSPAGNGSAHTTRHYYREVPPRFQQQKHHSKSPHSKQSSSANKKSTNRWSSLSSTDNNNQWSHSPDNSAKTGQSKGRGDRGGRGPDTKTPWDSKDWPRDKETWTSDEDSPLSNSDPVSEQGTHDMGECNGQSHKKGHDTGSDWEENDDAHNPKSKKLPNSDSDQSKDGAAYSSRDSPEEEGGGVGFRGHPSRSSMGSTSSVNSIGSSSSWKGTNRQTSYQHSPRKQGRYDNYRSSSVSSLGKSSNRHSLKSKKPVLDIEDAIESLHNEPSGWGELPSPKVSNVDTGTQVWGIPDDVKEKMKKRPDEGWGGAVTSNEWDSGTTPESNWGTDKSNKMEGVHWNESSSSGWNAVISEDKEGTKVKMLVDMGFSPATSKKTLLTNNHDMDAAIGDLLAITAVKEDDSTDSFLPPDTSPHADMLDSTVGGANSGNTSPPSTSSPSVPISGLGGAKDFTYHQIPSGGTHNQLSLGIQNHLLQQQLSLLVQRASASSPINGAIPPGISLPALHQKLSQNLSQCQHTEQAILHQLKSLPASSGASQSSQQSASSLPPSQEHILRQSLSQVTNNIKTIKQYLTAITKLHKQQLEAQVNERQDPPPSSTSQIPNEALEDAPLEASSRSSLATTPGDIKYGMQSMSLSNEQSNTSISQSSARTISRLHQIISGNGQEGGHHVDREKLELTEINNTSTVSSDPSTTGTYAGDGGTTSITTPSFVTTPSGPASLFGSTRSVDEIPEFKPGVPWQGSKTSKVSSSGGQPPTVSYGRSMSVDHDMFLPTSGSGMYNSSTPGAFTPQPIGHRNSLASASQFEAYRQYPSNNQQRLSTSSNNNSGGRYTTYRTTITNNSRSTNSNNYRSAVGQGPTSFSSNQRASYSTPQQPLGRTNSVPKQNQKWNFDNNNPWGMPVKSGSIWSIEDSEASNGGGVFNSSNMDRGASYSDWRPNRKPSLPLHLNAPTPYIILKNLSPQIDESSIREVCCEYGHVLSCSFNLFSESALVRYSSKEEAALANAGLEKNPMVCGIRVIPSLASDRDVASFTELRTPSKPTMGLASSLEVGNPSWLLDSRAKQPSPTSMSMPHSGSRSPSLWGTASTSTTSNTTNPLPTSEANSVWSNNELLQGISNPWNSEGQSDETTATSTTPPLSTFLPNGLF